MHTQERLAVSVNTACHMLGISRTSFYKLVKDGELSLRKIGRRSVILTTDLNSFIEGLSADNTGEARHDH